MNRIRTPEDNDRFKAALVPVDQAFWASEQKWGVGRLERLVSQSTLEAYRRGWELYRVALDEGDGQALVDIGPKMVAALAWMDAEASAAGNQPLAPDTWEAPLSDGTVLVVVRTNAEAIAVQRASRGAAFTGSPNGRMTVEPASTETTLPPDLAVTVRGQHEGRRLEVWTMAAIRNLIESRGGIPGIAGKHLKAGDSGMENDKIVGPTVGTIWEGDATQSGVQLDEGAAADMVRQGYPLSKPLAGSVSGALDF